MVTVSERLPPDRQTSAPRDFTSFTSSASLELLHLWWHWPP